MTRPILASLAAGALAALALAPMVAAARARTGFGAYIEAQQVLDVPISGYDADTVTYTSVAVGVDGSVQTRRLAAGVSARYEHDFGYGHDTADVDTLSGVGRVRLTLVPDLLSLDAGALATRTRVDLRGAAPQILSRDQANVTQVYSAYVGPTLATRVGALDVSALYRFGYTHVGDKLDLGLAPGEARLDTYDHSYSHFAAASVGMSPGELPFGWTVSGGWQREQVGELSQRFDDHYVRGDLLFPVSPTLALTAGAGYEWIKSSTRVPLIGPGGLPVLNGNGRYVADRTQPRLLAYDDTGVYYDAGVVWKPSPRTTLVATVGKRYGEVAVTGTFSHQIDKSSSVQVGVYNVVDSFGRSLSRNLSALPTSFTVPRNPFTNRIDGCVYSNDPRNAGGGCFDDSFQSLRVGDFRSRGVYAVYSATRGATTLGLGGGYAQRRYLTPTFLAGFGRTKDESASAEANLGFALSPNTSLQNTLYVDWYKSGLAGSGEVWTGGATSSLYHAFTDRLSGNAAVGLYAVDQDGFDTAVSGQFLLGARYQF